MKMLVVDDDSRIRDLIKYNLQLAGIRDIVEAKDGHEAVNLYIEHDPAGIVMDIRMPKLDGIEAIRLIRQVSKAVPIIVCTAYGDNQMRTAAKLAGATGFVTKPVNYQKLVIRLVEAAPQRSEQAEKVRRLNLLKLKLARYGDLEAPVHIITEIEDLEAELGGEL